MLRTVEPSRHLQEAVTPNPPDPPRATTLTCSSIEAVVYSKLGWPPVANTPEELAKTAAVLGYVPGLSSQIDCSK